MKHRRHEQKHSEPPARLTDQHLSDLEALLEESLDASTGDEEREQLLHVATRLASALAPLRQQTHSKRNTHESLTQLLWVRTYQTRHHVLQAPPRTMLFVMMAFLLACLMERGGTNTLVSLWNRSQQVLQTSTSLEQLKSVSITSLIHPHAGVKPLPLVPTRSSVPLQAATYGILTDASDATTMTTFVASYRIEGQDVELYEQPGDMTEPSSEAQRVRIGRHEGQVFADAAGNHALQWDQQQMLCQLTSKLSISLLIQLANTFQPVGNWAMLR